MIDVATLPTVSVEARRTMPCSSGVYFALSNDGQVLYIGQSKNLRQRWGAHEVLSQGVERIAWLGCPVDDLGTREREMIDAFRPKLNGLRHWREPVVTIPFDPDLLARVDDYRFRHRWKSRAAALRFLMTCALEEHAGRPRKAPRPAPAE